METQLELATCPHPQAHVEKNARAQRSAGRGNEENLSHFNGWNKMPGDGMVHRFGTIYDGMINVGGQSHLFRPAAPARPNNMVIRMGAPQPYGARFSTSIINQQMPSSLPTTLA